VDTYDQPISRNLRETVSKVNKSKALEFLANCGHPVPQSDTESSDKTFKSDSISVGVQGYHSVSVSISIDNTFEFEFISATDHSELIIKSDTDSVSDHHSVPQLQGVPAIKCIKAPTVFVDNYSRLRYVHFHKSTSEEGTIKGKKAFKCYSNAQGVKDQQYHIK
jgi:hypothetical protein